MRRVQCPHTATVTDAVSPSQSPRGASAPEETVAPILRRVHQSCTALTTHTGGAHVPQRLISDTRVLILEVYTPMIEGCLEG